MRRNGSIIHALPLATKKSSSTYIRYETYLQVALRSFMQIHRDLDALPVFKNAVITIGTFDGVHSGHQKIIKQLKAEAKNCAGETVIITFFPHPRMVVKQSQQQVSILTTLPEKIMLLEAQEINHLVIVPFTEAFSKQSPQNYICDFLVAKFHPHTIIIGYDHRFGNNRSGDYHLLEACAAAYNYAVKEIPEHVLNETTISSTRIREALLNGDIETANKFLGYTYFFEGTVKKGNQLGRTLGYPTANLQPTDEEKLIPANGVYAVEVGLVNSQWAMVNGQSSISDLPHTSYLTPHVLLKAMMNIGIRPTINGTSRVIEVNLFDFDEDIYEKTLRVYVKHRLRDEQKFNGLDALKTQLAKDKEDALRLL